MLECTLRDGSYAVDFKFTPADHRQLTAVLADLGFGLIEIGHGLGVSAGSGAPSEKRRRDASLVRAASEAGHAVQLGMFCIPGIAHPDDLPPLREAGLSFVRVGQNADDLGDAYEYVTKARNSGLWAAFNYMKSYVLSPAELAEEGRAAVDAGANAIYVVDSAGGMLPDDAARYIDTMVDAVDVPVGFHGHNNLQLATANALSAMNAGARLVDTTLYGVGRSAGNVPTEVLIALASSQIEEDVDLFELMRAAERYFGRLAGYIDMYSMDSVAMGASMFHSSYFETVRAAANRHRVDHRELLSEMGRRNPSSVDSEELETVAASLRKQPEAPRDSVDLASFPDVRRRETRIANTETSLAELLAELESTAAKSSRRAILEVTSSSAGSDSLVLAEYVTADSDMIMGRARVPNLERAREVFLEATDSIELFLVDTGAHWWRPDGVPAVSAIIDEPVPVVALDAALRRVRFVLRVALSSPRALGGSVLLVGGGPTVAAAVDELVEASGSTFWIHPPASDAGPMPGVTETDASALKNMGVPVDTVLLLDRVPSSEYEQLLGLLRDDQGRLYRAEGLPMGDELLDDPRVRVVDQSRAYWGILQEWHAARGDVG